MPTQQTATAARSRRSIHTDRAIYYAPDNAFKAKLPEVPKHVFLAERDRAFDPATGTALIDLDLSEVLETAYPATTPNMLARYARITAGDEIEFAPRAAGEAYYVIDGAATVTKGDDRIPCIAGDVAILPGGGRTRLVAEAESVVFVVTDEPALAFLHAEPPTPGNAPFQAVHYPGEQIMRHLEQHASRQAEEQRSGQAVLFSSAGVDRTKTATTTIALAMNSLEASHDQPPHRHNAAALTLAIRSEGVYSLIDGQRVDWHCNAVMVTPPTALHSHHNRGPERMLSLVAQDGGLFYNARAMGFRFE